MASVPLPPSGMHYRQPQPQAQPRLPRAFAVSVLRPSPGNPLRYSDSVYEMQKSQAEFEPDVMESSFFQNPIHFSPHNNGSSGSTGMLEKKSASFPLAASSTSVMSQISPPNMRREINMPAQPYARMMPERPFPRENPLQNPIQRVENPEMQQQQQQQQQHGHYSMQPNLPPSLPSNIPPNLQPNLPPNLQQNMQSNVPPNIQRRYSYSAPSPVG